MSQRQVIATEVRASKRRPIHPLRLPRRTPPDAIRAGSVTRRVRPDGRARSARTGPAPRPRLTPSRGLSTMPELPPSLPQPPPSRCRTFAPLPTEQATPKRQAHGAIPPASCAGRSGEPRPARPAGRRAGCEGCQRPDDAGTRGADETYLRPVAHLAAPPFRRRVGFQNVDYTRRASWSQCPGWCGGSRPDQAAPHVRQLHGRCRKGSGGQSRRPWMGRQCRHLRRPRSNSRGAAVIRFHPLPPRCWWGGL